MRKDFLNLFLKIDENIDQKEEQDLIKQRTVKASRYVVLRYHDNKIVNIQWFMRNFKGTLMQI